MYKILVNSANEGLRLTQSKYGTSTGTSYKLETASASATGTGYYTAVPIYSPGGHGAVSSQVYSSTAASAIDYEQLFTQTADPQPQTEDWTNFICNFTASDWDEWKMTAYATSEVSLNSPWNTPTPVFRAFLPPSSESALSASLPMDGYNWALQFGPYTYMSWSAYDSGYLLDEHSSMTGFSGHFSAQTDWWHPMHEIAGTATGELIAAVCCRTNMFGMDRDDWSAGLCSALPSGCYFSGRVQFRRSYTNDSSLKYETAEYTFPYISAGVVMGTGTAVKYDVPSGSVTMSSMAVVED